VKAHKEGGSVGDGGSEAGEEFCERKLGNTELGGGESGCWGGTKTNKVVVLY